LLVHPGIRINDQVRVFVGARENNRVQIFDDEGRYLTQWILS
jgi:hypothetical protein